MSTPTPAEATTSPPAPPAEQNYDFVVIGGGSGGLAAAKRAAGYGATVAVIESNRWGGTCVNVGCVPKKVMFNAAHVMEIIKQSKEFGFEGIDEKNIHFQWNKLKTYRDRYIQRLNTIYESGLEKLKITHINGFGSFIDKHTIKVDLHNNTATPTAASTTSSLIIHAKHFLIATGSKPTPVTYPGNEFVIDSNGFFELETQPKHAAVIGAGYIAVELAGVLNGLGTQTSLFCRHDKVLRSFDPMLSNHLCLEMEKHGPQLIPQSHVQSVVKAEDGTLTLNLLNGASFYGFDCIISAIGRSPNVDSLNLGAIGVQLDHDGYIKVDDYQDTNVKNVYALGDVIGKVELTPMAIAAGRRLGDRLFGGMHDAKADYQNVPTVVFSHPTIGTIGMTEPEALQAYGATNIKVYTNDFVNLWYGTFFEGNAGAKPISKYKIICEGEDERVVGIHIIGMGSDEVIQGFGVAMKMGATKADLDNCIAIHPTAAEELVTFAPWGLSGKKK